MIHAITATRAFDEAKKREASSKTCLKCQHEQLASEEKINTAIICEKCGTKIPLNAAANNNTDKNKQKSE